MLRQALATRNWPVAEGALQRLLQLGGAAADQLDLLAYVLLMQGRFTDFEATLEEALAAGSRSFWTPHKLGDARRGQQRHRAAVTAYEQALAWGSDSPLTVRRPAAPSRAASPGFSARRRRAAAARSRSGSAQCQPAR